MKEDSSSSASRHCKDCPAWKSSVFAQLRGQDLDLLQKEKSQSDYQRGDVFNEKGRPAQEMYCLMSGSAKVTLIDEQTGRQSLVRLVAPGGLLGYRCIFSVEHFRGTASALTSSVACKISKSFVLSLIDRNPTFSLELLDRMGQEIAAAEYHHHSFCQKNVRERVAEAFLILKEKYGEETPQGWRIGTRLTRPELSDWVGASRESVIREITNFTQEGLITQIGSDTYVLDCASLEKICGYRPK